MGRRVSESVSQSSKIQQSKNPVIYRAFIVNLVSYSLVPAPFFNTRLLRRVDLLLVARDDHLVRIIYRDDLLHQPLFDQQLKLATVDFPTEYGQYSIHRAIKWSCTEVL
jgi:hypothetical protein